LAWRAPNILLAPRFYAEEGAHYFRFAFEHGLLESLTFVFRKVGYFNLITNVAAGSATLVPLEYAPIVTTYVALVVQAIPLVLILYGNSTLFRGAARKAVGCLIVLFSPAVASEVWLTSLSSQVYLGLSALLILLEDMRETGPVRRWLYRLLLALGGLSGVYTVFLLPLFGLRALLQRGRERLVQLSIVTLAASIQIALVASMDWFNPLRMRDLGLVTLSRISLYQVGIPLVGHEAARSLTVPLGAVGEYAFLIAFLAAAVFSWVDWRRRRLRLDDDGALLALAVCILAACTSLLSLKGIPGGRYAVLSGFAILFAVLHHIRPRRRPALSGALILLLSFSLFTGMRTYRAPEDLRCDGSRWKDEVARWREEPFVARAEQRPVSDRLRICPSRMRFQMRLPHPDRDRVNL
jgi:hypothetical protein